MPKDSKMFTSVFNDVLGPIMRGPSSSHTAGSYHIALVVRDLLGGEPKKVNISFDTDGSYGSTYVQQGVDQAFTTGLMGWKQTDEIFTAALSTAKKRGVDIDFDVTGIQHADHPNYVIIEVEDQQGQQLKVEAKSTGGGTFKIIKVDDADVLLGGKTYETLLTIASEAKSTILKLVQNSFPQAVLRTSSHNGSKLCIQLSSTSMLFLDKLTKQSGIQKTRQAKP
ncbi:MAG: hypothetical protein HKP52_01455, partial [Desulfofustis sp.]|nr:hypothetical protein [Desulfofustis sp.]